MILNSHIFIIYSGFLGVFAVASMMVGNVVTTLINDKQQLTTSINNVTSVYVRYYSTVVPFEVTPVTLISTLTFTVSLYQVCIFTNNKYCC